VYKFHETEHDCVGFEVLTAVVNKRSIFLDITPCSPFTVNQLFGGTCRLNLQCRSISQETIMKLVVGRVFIDPEDGSEMFVFFLLSYSSFYIQDISFLSMLFPKNSVFSYI
jgi:hypothetical protein